MHRIVITASSVPVALYAAFGHPGFLGFAVALIIAGYLPSKASP